jgi:hypothetical protein
MLFMETVAICSDKETNPINKLYRRNVVLFKLI